MCGIVGYIGKDYSGSKKIYQGLKNLEYRGYDSCGIAISNDKDNKIEIFKSLGDANNLLKFKEPNGKEILSIPVDRVVSVVSRFGEIIYP